MGYNINMGIDKSFEELVLRLNKENHEEIFSFKYKEKKYWLKKARATKSNIFHKIFYKLTSINIMIPVKTKTPREAMLFEIEKIQKFSKNGILTPNILIIKNDFFVMSDSGIPLYKLLKKSKSEEELYKYTDKLIETLSLIHLKGLYHGGAQSRNFTYLKDSVAVIDFEESFDETVSLKTLQLRDLILLLLSMSKLKKFNIDYEYIIKSYCDKSGNRIFLNQLKNLFLQLNFLVKICEIKLIKKFLPNDVKGLLKLIKSLNKI